MAEKKEKQSHETATLWEIVQASESLEVLLNKGFKNGPVARKLAGILRWAKSKAEEYQDARESLVEAHAKKDDDGNRIPGTRLNPQGEQVEDSRLIVPKNQSAWEKAQKELRKETVNLNGQKITPSDLEETDEVIEPALITYLGPLYDWEADVAE